MEDKYNYLFASKASEPSLSTVMSGASWSLRLRGPRGQTAALQVDGDTTIARLCELAAESLELGAPSGLTFRCGFPPRPLTAEPTALVKDSLARNDTVVVDRASSAGKVTAAKPQAPKKSPASRGKSPAAAKKKPVAKATGVHSLHAASAKKAAPAKRKISGQGFQLGSSLDDDPPAEGAMQEQDEEERVAGQQRYRRTRAIHLSSKEDVELALANAVSGRSNDRTAKFFRAATRNAVDHQYQVNIATARLNAARSNRFETQEVRMARRAGEPGLEAAEMKVRFKEGARKWLEETVMLVQPAELQATIKYVLLSGGETGKEMLKPFNMAQASPRVFWSIARLYNGDIEAGLADLVPDQDWSYLDVRARAMSQKAIEAKANEEQWKLWKKRNARIASPPSSPPPEQKKSRSVSMKQEVIEIESDAEQDVHVPAQGQQAANKPSAKRTPALKAKEATVGALRSAMAQAALSRFGQSERTSQVVAAFENFSRKKLTSVGGKDDDETETEDEDDVEETTTVYCDECNKARILTLDEASRAEANGDDDSRWTCDKLTQIGRTTACEALDDEVTQIVGPEIAGLLSTSVGISTRRELADASVRSTVHALINPSDPSIVKIEEALTKMIDEARLDEVNDMMLELAGGNEEIVGALELQKLGTPADLLVTPSDLVLQALALSTTNVTMQMVLDWQQQAEDAIASRKWMREWRTL